MSFRRCLNAKSKILISSITEVSIAAYWGDHSNTGNKMANEFPVCATGMPRPGLLGWSPGYLFYSCEAGCRLRSLLSGGAKA